MFIRTVNKHSHNPNPSLTDHNAGSVTQIGGSARMSVEGTGLIAHNSSDNVNIHDTIHNNGVQNNLEQNQYTIGSLYRNRNRRVIYR